MGPSFSITESLPGVVPVFSGVPYLLVRGATPAGSLFYYDGIEVPTLFHVALGPSIVDPHLLGAMHFYAGAALPRYGAHIGGVSSYAATDPESLRVTRREVELSLLDTSGRLNLPLQDGAFSISWRLGNPGLMLAALRVALANDDLDATLSYYDYQVRYESRIAEHTRVLLLALGANDQLGERTAPQDDIKLTFHRLQARITHQIRDVEFGARLLLGSDASTLGQELRGTALRAAPGLFMQWQRNNARLRVGADMSTAVAQLSRGPSDSSMPSAPTRDNRITLDPQDFLDGQPFTSVPGRSLNAVYSEFELRVLQNLELQLGLRGDLWLSGSAHDAALSPQFALRYRALHWLELHSAFAFPHNPRTSPIPLPGLNDIALDHGVQGALQAEAGVTVHVTDDTQVDVTGFYHRYLDVVYFELILDCQGNTNPSAAQAVLTRQDPRTSICRRSGLPTADGDAAGMELLLKRALTRDLSGFLSYTLTFANATAVDGTRFSPQSDVRHTLNAVLSYEIGGGFAVGIRVHYRSGKPAVNTVYDLSTDEFTHLRARLPGFFRLDLRATYRWLASFGQMEASIGMQNVTASHEATNRDCVPVQSNDSSPVTTVQCSVDYQPFIVLPNIGLKASF